VVPETRRILVVEDDESVRGVLALTLDVAGYEVKAVPDGADALDLLINWQPDLILLDLRMPVMDGWTFRREQLASNDLSEIPVVLLSGANEADSEAEKMAVDGVIPKPFDLSELLATVDHLAGHGAWARLAKSTGARF
jgi:two-component system, chemotaxis family, chemotaxis protein CheY